MRTYQPHSRRSRFPALIFGGLALSLLVGGGLLASLWLLGVNLNPFGTTVTEDPYVVRIPINSQPIAAYSRVDRSQIMDPRTGVLTFQKVPPSAAVGMSITGIDLQGSQAEGRVDAIKRTGDEVIFVVNDGREVPQSQTTLLGGAMMNVGSIVGRVMKRDKKTGYGFTENDFFPQGTPEGIAGATPTGMRAMTLDATRLIGVHALNAGDRVDLMATLSPEDAEAAKVSAGASENGNYRAQADSEPVLLAQDVVLLKPVYVRTEASTTASLMQGKQIQNVPKYEVAIAVKPDDVIALQAALNRSLQITCITHSMQVTKPGSEPVALVSQPDMVSVPVTVRTIYAYDVVSREAFISPATRTLKTETVSRQQVDRMGLITSLDEMLGSIARHDISAGRFLRRSDLLAGPPGSVPESNNSSTIDAPAPDPLDATLETTRGRLATTLVSDVRPSPADAGDSDAEDRRVSSLTMVQDPAANRPVPGQSLPSAMAVGDRPAITRFIPPGRTALAIPWNRIYSAEHLQIGDRIDLMASYSLSQQETLEETETRPDGTVIVRRSESLAPRKTERTWDESFGFRAEPWFVATDAVVIAPVGFPAPASALRALGTSAQQDTRAAGNQPNGPPIIVAVDERDVEAVATALSTDGAVFTVAFRASESPGARVAPGTKHIVVTPEPLQPYQEFNEQKWKGNRRRIASRVVAINDSRFENAITVDDVDEYYGRVLAKGKSLGDHLVAADFLPPGTMPGLSSATGEGYTIFAIADSEIAGLENVETGDRVTILRRGTLDLDPSFFSAGLNMSRVVSDVVVEQVRVARRSLAGQSVLEVRNRDLSHLQAAIAQSMSESGPKLIAVVLPQAGVKTTNDVVTSDNSTIPSYDPYASAEITEVIIGRERTKRVYLGAAQ